MSNPLLSLLDIDYPLIQAPMAGVSTPALAAAVSNAGALGSLGLGASTVAQAEAMIVATRQLTDRPFNVNLFCHAPPRRDGPAGSRLGNNITSPFCPLWQYATGFVKRDLPDIYRSCADAGAASRHLAGGGELSFWPS
ncbi:enoyl-[acyl-carrier-protein] reductase [Klebsiella pneumoniae]|uniref:Propionate 3-nitronate monooxygenase n=1 Tax=Klebsiella pneumoniae TaxID=573 RepID=A0A4P0Y7R4_KLEPN|nr:enoyl-[acyl-carrier-protein] reductase [Klebsiella pneumoniae]